MGREALAQFLQSLVAPIVSDWHYGKRLDWNVPPPNLSFVERFNHIKWQTIKVYSRVWIYVKSTLSTVGQKVTVSSEACGIKNLETCTALTACLSFVDQPFTEQNLQCENVCIKTLEGAWTEKILQNMNTSTYLKSHLSTLSKVFR